MGTVAVDFSIASETYPIEVRRMSAAFEIRMYAAFEVFSNVDDNRGQILTAAYRRVNFTD